MKQKMKRVLLLPLVPAVIAVGTLGTLAQGTTSSKTDDVRKAIESAEARFGTLFEKGDMQALSELYTEDGQVMPPNSAPANGRAAIKAFWQGARDAGVAKLEVKTVETSGTGGNTAYEIGTYILYNKAGEAIDDGKFIVIWRRDGKSWYLYRDIWNSNRK